MREYGGNNDGEGGDYVGDDGDGNIIIIMIKGGGDGSCDNSLIMILMATVLVISF